MSYHHLGKRYYLALLPKMLVDFASAGLRDPKLSRLDTDVKISENLRMAFFKHCDWRKKPPALIYILRNIIPQEQQPSYFFPHTFSC